MLAAHGGRHGGYAIFIKDNKLYYEANFLGLESFRCVSENPLPAGPLTIRLDFVKTDTLVGIARLYVDGNRVAEVDVSRIARLGGMLEGFDIGRDRQTPVSDLYECPFEFTGTLHKVEYQLLGRETLDPQAELDQLLAVE